MTSKDTGWGRLQSQRPYHFGPVNQTSVLCGQSDTICPKIKRKKQTQNLLEIQNLSRISCLSNKTWCKLHSMDLNIWTYFIFRCVSLELLFVPWPKTKIALLLWKNKEKIFLKFTANIWVINTYATMKGQQNTIFLKQQFSIEMYSKLPPFFFWTAYSWTHSNKFTLRWWVGRNKSSHKSETITSPLG